MRKECALTHVLNHKLARPLFEKKLKEEYADEALQFFDGVTSFAQRPPAELPAASWTTRLRRSWIGQAGRAARRRRSWSCEGGRTARLR